MSNKFQIMKNENLELRVYTAAESSFGVTSTIVCGVNDAILIDAQFTLNDARIVAEEIKSSGKNLTAILITHGDPDYYFGLEAIKQYFPKAIVYATQQTVEHIKATSQKKLNVWSEKLGDNGTKNIILPQILDTNMVKLDDYELFVTGTDSSPERTFVWIPQIKAVVGGINVFGTGLHIWMADSANDEAINKWLSVLDKIESLEPKIVIPAHSKDTSELNINSVIHVKEYLNNYLRSKQESVNSEELIKKIQNLYPLATFNLALELGAKVNMGEMKW